MDALRLPHLSGTDALAQAQTKALEAKQGQSQEAALMFEGMLWMQIAQSMRSTVQPSGLFGNTGQARGTYEFMLDQAVVEQAMKAGKSLGLANQLEKAWAAQQNRV